MVAAPKTAATLINCTLGNYAVDALLGRGATSTVYLARDLTLQRRVALKVLLGSVAREPQRLEQFRAEARATAVLQHPNIVRIFEAGVREGIPFIAMEYVEGETLERFLLRQGKLPWQAGLHIAQQVAVALDLAHRNSIIHRDIKPSNILLDRQGGIRLTDFGLAAAQDHAGHMAAGTPDYMSPEQCDARSKVTPSSDLFSLGVLLYRMLSGTLPFSGETALGLMKSILSDTPARLNRVIPGIPDDVARLVAHLLEKSPGARPASAGLVAERIHRIQEEDGGASALPAALNAFIREQAQPQHTHEAAGAHGAPSPSPDARLFYAPVSLLARLAAAAIVCLSAAGAGYWHFLRADPGMAAIELPARFVQQRDGAYRVQLPHPDWRVEAMHWLGDQPVLVLSLAGQPGTSLHGARGLLALDAKAGDLLNVHLPSGPILAGTMRQTRPVSPSLPVLPVLAMNSPFRECIPLPQAVGADTVGFQPWTGVAPRHSFRLPDIAGDGLSSPFESLEADFAFSGDGTRVGLAIPARDYLGVYEPGASGPRALALPPGLKLAPHSLQYAPERPALLFLARNGSVSQALWKYEEEASLLSAGDYDAFGLSPEGDLVALQQITPSGPMVAVLEIGGGAGPAPLGRGTISEECWGGGALVCAAKPGDGSGTVIVALRPGATGAPEVVSETSGHVAQAPACSRDGDWVAFTEVDNGIESLRVVPRRA